MEISEQTVKQVAILILIVISIIVMLLLFGVLTGNKLARAIACGALFWVPFGSLAIAFTQGCAAVPV